MTTDVNVSPQVEAVALPSPPAVVWDDPHAAVAQPARDAWQRAKRMLDVVFAVALLIAVAPLLALLAIAIRLDSPGPLLFRQERYGRGCRRFTVLKLRTMYDGVSAEAHRRYIEQLARAPQEETGQLKKLVDDPRVTRVGALLRRTSLDELPQLINVIKGEMSIVGPRPALDYELEHYALEHYERFGVRPGLTGLWQVSGRNSLGFLEMLDLDAEYARISSPGVDAKILLRTPLAVLRASAA